MAAEAVAGEREAAVVAEEAGEAVMPHLAEDAENRPDDPMSRAILQSVLAGEIS